LLGEPADPSRAAIVGAMASEDLVHSAHQLERQLGVARRSRHLPETEEGADREGVGPQVALLRARRREAGALREPRHQFDRLLRAPSHAATIRSRYYFFCRRVERLRAVAWGEKS